MLNTVTLHPTLQRDSFHIGELPLCTCRLVDNVYFPWLILIPKVADVSEIFQLKLDLQMQLIKESSWVSRRLHQAFEADKINVAALGNQVPQLHIHHIVRYTQDDAWPEPIWGKAHKSYDANTKQLMLDKLKHALTKDLGEPQDNDLNFTWSNQFA